MKGRLVPTFIFYPVFPKVVDPMRPHGGIDILFVPNAGLDRPNPIPGIPCHFFDGNRIRIPHVD